MLEKNKRLLKKLSEWGYDEIYSLPEIHDIEVQDEFYNIEVSELLNLDIPKDEVTDTFLGFANSADGGEYCLWFYPELTGEPPVVFINLDWEHSLIASSFTEFIKRLGEKKVLDSSMDFGDETSPWDENDVTIFEDSDISQKVALFNLDFEELLEEVKEENHPSFYAWVVDITEKYQ